MANVFPSNIGHHSNSLAKYVSFTQMESEIIISQNFRNAWKYMRFLSWCPRKFQGVREKSTHRDYLNPVLKFPLPQSCAFFWYFKIQSFLSLHIGMTIQSVYQMLLTPTLVRSQHRSIICWIGPLSVLPLHIS